jgi:site-specific DNA recombinase
MTNVNKDVTKEKKRGVGYCRVSTSDQSKNGLSMEVQADMCKTTMEGDGVTVVEIIKDEGKSGGSLKRDGIKKVMEMVAKNEIGYVYTVHSDRIARNTLDYLNFRELLRKNDVELKCMYQPIQDDSATSRTMDTVMASFNEMHRLLTSEKVRETLNKKAKAGYFPSTPPPGYKNIDNPDEGVGRLAKKIVVQDPETVPFVKEFYKLYSTGNFNVYDLGDIMYEKGLRSRRGGKLTRSRLYDLLRNRFYLGEVHWGKIHNKEGKHGAIIDESLFNQVQSVLSANNNHACRRRKYTWLLNGFLYCYKHEKRYTAEWHLKKKVAYYHCTNKSGCGKYSEQVQMENKVADKFKELEFDEGFTDKIIEKVKELVHERRKGSDSKRQGLVNRKTALESRKKVMEDKLLDGLIKDEDFTEKRKELNDGLELIDGELLDIRDKQDLKIDIAQEVINFTKDIHKSYKKASPTLKRHYLSFFWDKFEVADAVIIKSHPTLLFSELLRLEQLSLKMPEIPIAKRTKVYKEVITRNVGLPGQDSNL